jgi:hypothetical protein
MRCCRVFIYSFFSFWALLLLTVEQPSSLNAAESDAALRAQVVSWLGTWEFSEPRSGPQFLILRAGGNASMFSGHANTSAVMQGRWRFDGVRLEVNWPERGIHVLERRDGDFLMSYIEPETEGFQFTVAATRMPTDYLGSWAVDPVSRRDQTQRENEDSGFFGNWLIQPNGDEPYFILIRNDRSAATSLTSKNAASSGKLGTWARQGTELHITWEDASYTVFQVAGDAFSVVHFPTGESLDKERSDGIPARRIRRDAVDADWLERFNAERDEMGWGIRFETQRAAQRFYRGNWLVDRSDFGVERISLGRMGGIRSTRRPIARGEWRLSTQDLFLNWEDGFRQVITPIGSNFVLFEYAAGRPVDAVPSRVFQAVPEDLEKLSAAQRERKIAHPVFESEPVRAEQRGGWFSDLWPFGGERRQEFPEDTFVQGDERSVNNPWWWPFWSENEAIDLGDEFKGKASDDLNRAVELDLAETDSREGSSDQRGSRVNQRSWLAIP